MTNPPLKKNHHSNLLKGIALMIGYTFFYIASSSHVTVTTLSVPLCFYNTSTDTRVQAPESISVTLSGIRSDIRALDRDHLAIHIDATCLHPGKNIIQLSKKELLLPRHIKLLHYAPSNPVVELSEAIIV